MAELAARIVCFPRNDSSANPSSIEIFDVRKKTLISPDKSILKTCLGCKTSRFEKRDLVTLYVIVLVSTLLIFYLLHLLLIRLRDLINLEYGTSKYNYLKKYFRFTINNSKSINILYQCCILFYFLPNA